MLSVVLGKELAGATLTAPWVWAVAKPALNAIFTFFLAGAVKVKILFGFFSISETGTNADLS